VARALEWFLGHAEEPYVVNVNVPDLPVDQVRGLRAGGLASLGAVPAKVGERGQGYVTITFEEIDFEPDPLNDLALLRQGWATATAVQAPTESLIVDLSTIG
jgi:5'-nucleotidase